MFAGSSRRLSGINVDGSYSIRCSTCGKHIAKSIIGITKAQCILCARTEEGLETPPNVIREYEMGKMEKADVSMLLVPQETPILKAKFTLRSLGGEILQAMGITKPEEKAPESANIAKKKRRPRLFENIKLGEETQEHTALGSIVDIDSKLNEVK